MKQRRDSELSGSLQVRADFPLLANNSALHYLDSAATSQKPRVVLDAIREYYEHDNANPHRGVYALSEEATAAYESARERVATFINAASVKEVIFTRNTTEAINAVMRLSTSAPLSTSARPA